MAADKPIRVVIAEDSPYDAELALHALKRHGYSVQATVACTADALRAALAAAPPDVVISDCSMPQMDGSMALEIARALAPAVPFVFLTGSAGHHEAAGLAAAGAAAVLDKQDMSRLGAVVEKALAAK